VELSRCPVGGRFEGCLAVRQAVLKRARNGNPYLDMRLSDGVIEASGKFWDYRGEAPAPGTVVAVAATVEVYNERKQLVLAEMTPAAPGTYDVSRFLPVSPADLAGLQARLVGIVAGLAPDPYGELAAALLTEHWEDFCCAPAAVYHHHARLGGLLEHTVSVAERCIALSVGQEGLDMDLLLAGAVLHDIGKVREYTWAGPAFGVSDVGAFLGHAIIGVNMIDRMVRDGFPSLADTLAVIKLQHLVASHHGQKEWGAGVLPAMPEAYLLHQADLMDANLFQMARARDEAAPGARWTAEKIRNLGTRLWVGE